METGHSTQQRTADWHSVGIRPSEYAVVSPPPGGERYVATSMSVYLSVCLSSPNFLYVATPVAAAVRTPLAV